jgi:hypothetical protein
MDSIAQLALITKAKNVFGSESTFLSFPVTPLAYKEEDFEFFSQDTKDDLLKSKANLHAFSTLVNLIPSGEAWLPTDAHFLWDEYEYVLENGICASSSRTPEEEMDFLEVKAYLKAPGEGGFMVDSPQVKVYNQYKDAYYMAQEEYMAARSTGETTDDESEKKLWQEVGDPEFRKKLEELEKEWILEGFRDEVETAISKFVILSAKSPFLRWNEWVGQFDSNLDSDTSASDHSMVFPSNFAPSNALEEGSWKPFSLNESEVTALVNKAPADLRKRFGADGKASSIKSMTMEFSSAVIKRHWFDSEVFRSRFWRLADTAKVISDGGIPPSGDCPAYVTAIVFARKVIVEQKAANKKSSNQKVVDLRFNYAVKDQTKIKQINPAILKAVQPQPQMKIMPHYFPPQKIKMHPVQSHMIKENRRATVSSKRAAISKSAAIRTPTQPKRGQVRDHRQNLRLNQNVTIQSKKGKANQIYPLPMYNLKMMEFARIPTKPTKRPVTPPAKPQKAPETIPDKNIYILAFVCKPLPKCPDPDSTLQW